MEIIEYQPKYDEQIKDLLDELQEHLVRVDDWHTQILHKDYREENFRMDKEKVEKQEGKIYLAKQQQAITGLIIGVVEEKDAVDRITNDCAKTGIVLELVVQEGARSAGIGKKLLKQMEEYFKSIQCQRITIEVFGPNQSAHDFYLKNGYVERDIFMGKRIR